MEPDEEQKKIDAMRQAFEGAKSSAPQASAYIGLLARVLGKVQTRIAADWKLNPTDKERRALEAAFTEALSEAGIVLARAERERMWVQVQAEVYGLGPLEAILADAQVMEIMINGYQNIYVERNGQLEEVPSTFRDDDHLLDIIRRIATPLGRKVDESHPIVDLRLSDGSRVNAIVPPIALSGPCLTIRKFYRAPLSIEQLLAGGTLDSKILEFLRACVLGRANLIVSGGTGAGKTTLLNVLANMIPEGERIITIEDASELRLRQKHVVVLESRPPNLEGRGEITLRDLVINALKMRPERLVVGELRGAEALDFLQAINTGHDGAMSSMHANNPRDTLARLETLASAGNASIPLLTLREQMASGLNLIVHVERLADGSRKIMRVTEVQGLLGDSLQLTDLFTFQPTGVEARVIAGRHIATGKIPSFLHQLRQAGIALPMEMFAPPS
jgi:pilus assembly protein CpaF